MKEEDTQAWVSFAEQASWHCQKDSPDALMLLAMPARKKHHGEWHVLGTWLFILSTANNKDTNGLRVLDFGGMQSQQV